MSGQSSTIKGWCVTVTSALLAASATTNTPITGILALYVIMTFAVLDAYYLAIERAYRVLYDSVAATDPTATPSWTMSITRPGTRQILATLRSPAISLLYSSSALVAIVVAAYTARI